MQLAHFMLDAIRIYFAQKAADYNLTARRLLRFPEDSFACSRGKLAKALADLFAAIAASLP